MFGLLSLPIKTAVAGVLTPPFHDQAEPFLD